MKVPTGPGLGVNANPGALADVLVEERALAAKQASFRD
jgi:hypothetical protein